LTERQGITVGHSELLRAVWGAEFEDEVEYLRSYVSFLRKKIESDSARPEYIITEPEIGYRFQDRPPRSKERRPRSPDRFRHIRTTSRATPRIV